MNQEIKIIKNTIKNNFNRYYPDLLISDLEIKVLREKSIIHHHYATKRYHVIIDAQTRDGQKIKRHIFAKKLTAELANQEAGNYKLLKKYYLGDLIPNFFDLIKECNILLTEYIYPSENLLIKIFKAAFWCSESKKRQVEKLIQESAVWLTEFQKKCFLKNIPDLDTFIKKAREQLGEMPYFNQEQQEKILKKLRYNSQGIGNISLIYSPLDFCPRNILVTLKDKVVVIDWMSLAETYSYFDLHHFVVNLEGRTRHSLLFSKDYIEKLKDVLIKAYNVNTSFKFSKKAYLITRKLYLIDYLYIFYTYYRDRAFTFKKSIFWQKNKRKLINELIEYSKD